MQALVNQQTILDNPNFLEAESFIDLIPGKLYNGWEPKWYSKVQTPLSTLSVEFLYFLGIVGWIHILHPIIYVEFESEDVNSVAKTQTLWITNLWFQEAQKLEQTERLNSLLQF